MRLILLDSWACDLVFWSLDSSTEHTLILQESCVLTLLHAWYLEVQGGACTLKVLDGLSSRLQKRCVYALSGLG